MNKKNILMVDDDITITKTMSIVIETLGHYPTTATSGEEAINIIKNQHIDIVLMDFNMPKMNGIETLEQIRKFNNSLPVFILTAEHNFEQLKQKAIKTGAQGCIKKPPELKVIINTINTYV